MSHHRLGPRTFAVPRQKAAKPSSSAGDARACRTRVFLEKARRLVKQFQKKYGKDVQAGALESASKRLGEKPLQLLMDSSSKWSSTFVFLERLCRLKRTMQEVAASSGHLFATGTFLTELEYLTIRDVVGVLRPLVNATNLMQSDGFMGSSYLPVMHTLKRELSSEIRVQVSAGGMDWKQTMPLAESNLCEPARRFRQKVRDELALVERHVEPCRETMALAAALDPRYKHLL